jgi:hypothetical protein
VKEERVRGEQTQGKRQRGRDKTGEKEGESIGSRDIGGELERKKFRGNRERWEKHSRRVSVRELMGRVRNVVLIKCILDLGNPRGVGFGREGTWAG